MRVHSHTTDESHERLRQISSKVLKPLSTSSGASIRYYALKESFHVDIEKELTKLRTMLSALGFDYEQRRQAAFAGLVALNRSSSQFRTPKGEALDPFQADSGIETEPCLHPKCT
jgi:hypothetical protein